MAKSNRSSNQPLLDFDNVATFPEGFHYIPGYFDAAAQKALLVVIRDVLTEAPLFTQAMPRTGAPLSVRMSNTGAYGWVTDRDGGYRYQPTHPQTGLPWPAIPQQLLDLWADVTQEVGPPNQCLINYYDREARLGLHQDKGDDSLAAPVVSVSLGDDATFLIGGMTRKDRQQAITLKSGDVVWFGGPSRLIYHGIEGIFPGTSNLLPEGGRINLTIRRIDR